MRGLFGKAVLVTGGATGIGQAIAVRMGEEGARVAINYLKSEDGSRETARLVTAAREQHQHATTGGPHALIVQGDVSSEDDVQRMFETVIREFGQLDILVNNAGMQEGVTSHELEAESFDRVIAVNLRGAFLCARNAIAHFLETGVGGSILNVSSVHETIPKPEFLSYAISKGGLRSLTRTLALEYASRGIRVNAIGPGVTLTPMNEGLSDDPEQLAEVEGHIPMRRAATPDEMAASAAFLCSDEAAYVTGQTLFVDGGLTLYADFREAWASE
jgi:glucose 1-dehydrogenase